MLLNLWNKLSRLPFGKKIFSCILGMKVPYTGSIRPSVIELAPGRVKVQMRDRKKIRNHLNSIHAVALMNIAEVSSGLSVITSLPSEARAILTHFEIDFIKKARGTLTASAQFAGARSYTESQNYEVEAIVQNEQNEIVARARATWLIGPNRR